MEHHAEVCSLSCRVPDPYPTRDRPAFAFSAMSYPHPYRLALRLAFPRKGGIRTYHVPRIYPDGLGSACTPVTLHLRQDQPEGPVPGHIPFGSSLLPYGHSTFGLSLHNDASDGSSHILAIPSTQPPSRLVLAATTSPHGSAASFGRAILSRRASDRRITPTACSGRVKGQNPWSIPHVSSYVINEYRQLHMRPQVAAWFLSSWVPEFLGSCPEKARSAISLLSEGRLIREPVFGRIGEVVERPGMWFGKFAEITWPSECGARHACYGLVSRDGCLASPPSLRNRGLEVELRRLALS